MKDQRKPFAPTTLKEIADYLSPIKVYVSQESEAPLCASSIAASEFINGLRNQEHGFCLSLARELAQAHGFAVVPREATEAMWTAGRDPVMARDLKLSKQDLAKGGISHTALNAAVWFKPEIDGSQDSRHPTKGDTAVWVYRAMIAAAATGEGK